MRYSIRLVYPLCMAAVLVSATGSCLADEPATKKTEAPSGYEDAPEAKEAPKAKEAPRAMAPPKAKAAPKAPVREEGEADEDEDLLEQKVDANVLRMEKQFLPQFQRLVKVECSFMLRACELDKKQQARISEVSDRCAKVAARRFAIALHNPRPFRAGVHGRGNATATHSDPREEIGGELLESVSDLLSQEQKDRYAEENQKRKDHVKQVVILNLVVLIDKRLVLTAEQREQLTASLTKNWDPSWTGALSSLMHNSQYLPRIPDKHVVTFLTDKQRVVWQGTRKVGYSAWGNFVMHHDGPVIDDGFAVPEEEAVVEDEP